MSAQGPPAGPGGGANGGSAGGPPGAGGNSTVPPWQPHLDLMKQLGVYIPDGWYPGYEKDWKGYVHIPVHITVIIVATIFIILRVYTRAFIVRNFGWDDTLMIIAWVITMAGGGTAIYGMYISLFGRGNKYLSLYKL